MNEGKASFSPQLAGWVVTEPRSSEVSCVYLVPFYNTWYGIKDDSEVPVIHSQDVSIPFFCFTSSEIDDVNDYFVFLGSQFWDLTQSNFFLRSEPPMGRLGSP